jgi:hypothetical protein
MNVSASASQDQKYHHKREKRTESNKGIWLAYALYFWTICSCELLPQFVEIRKCKFSRVRLVRDGQKHDIISNKVAMMGVFLVLKFQR